MGDLGSTKRSGIPTERRVLKFDYSKRQKLYRYICFMNINCTSLVQNSKVQSKNILYPSRPNIKSKTNIEISIDI